MLPSTRHSHPTHRTLVLLQTRRDECTTSTVKKDSSMEAVAAEVGTKTTLISEVSAFSPSGIPKTCSGSSSADRRWQIYSEVGALIQLTPQLTVPKLTLCLDGLFADFHDHGYRDRRRNRHSHPQNALSSTLFSPFGVSLGGSLMDDFFNAGHGGFTSFSTINSTFTKGAGGGSANVKRTSTSTRFSNGKKITTKK